MSIQNCQSRSQCEDKYLIWCINFPSVNNRTFVNTVVYFDGAFSLWLSLIAIKTNPIMKEQTETPKTVNEEKG